MVAGKILQLAVGQALSIAQDDRHANFLAELGVGNGKSNRLCDGRMIQQDFVDLDRGYLLAAAVDQRLE